MGNVKKEYKVLIHEAVNAGIQAGREQAKIMVKDAYKATEKRLYALPTLEKKVKDEKELLAEIMTNGTRERSKSLVRFTRSGQRISPEELLEAVIADKKATIAADEHTIEQTRRALEHIADDPYAQTVTMKYLKKKSDEEIAAAIPCEQTTVWRNRKRLVQSIAVYLFGSNAL